MAFLNRVGNVLKQAVSKHAASSKFMAPNASLFQAMRCMSTSSKLFVGGLSYSTDELSLKEAFSQYGEVVEARVIKDRDTGRSRGFGFVTFTSSEAASSAIQGLDNQDLHGRQLRVNYAAEKPRTGGFGAAGGYGSSGSGGYGGGYGGSGGYGGGYGGSGGGGYGGGGYQGGGGGGYQGGGGGGYQGGGGGYQGGGGGYQGGGGGGYQGGGGGYQGGGGGYQGGGGGYSSGIQNPPTQSVGYGNSPSGGGGGASPLDGFGAVQGGGGGAPASPLDGLNPLKAGSGSDFPSGPYIDTTSGLGDIPSRPRPLADDESESDHDILDKIEDEIDNDDDYHSMPRK